MDRAGMLDYMIDAQLTEEPWLLYEVSRDKDTWWPCPKYPNWNELYFRRVIPRPERSMIILLEQVTSGKLLVKSLTGETKVHQFKKLIEAIEKC